MTGTDVTPGIPEALQALFDSPESPLSDADKANLTAITLVDIIPIGQSTIIQSNPALALYPNDEFIQDNVKTKDYIITGSPDDYAIVIQGGEQEITVKVVPEIESLTQEYVIKSNITFAAGSGEVEP